MKARTRRFAAYVLIVSLAFPLPPARAGMLATDAALGSERERIVAVLEREDVRAQLLAYGVDEAQVTARVDALTDDEAALLAAKLDTLPAGGRAEAFLIAVAVVFLLPVVLVLGAVGLMVAAITKSTPATTHEAGTRQ
jgi:hypothetical protein